MNLCKDSCQCAVALLAIVTEVTAGPLPPHSADSYLPTHLIEQARAVLAAVGIKAPA